MPNDTPTGDPVATGPPPGEIPIEMDASAVLRRFHGASLVEVTRDEASCLELPFPDSEIEILPTGEPYAPNGRYRERLNHVFGQGRWALLPAEPHVLDGKSLLQWWVLTVRGGVVATAPGGGTIGFDGDLSQALESAKSNALTRACKDLGIGLFLAQKRWAETFRERFCLMVDAKDRKEKDWRRCWRRADGVPFPYEGTIHRKPAPQKDGAQSDAPAQPPAPAPEPAEPAAATTERGKGRTAKEREEEFFAEMANQRKRVGGPAYMKVLEKAGHTAMGAIPPAKRAGVLAELASLPAVKA